MVRPSTPAWRVCWLETYYSPEVREDYETAEEAEERREELKAEGKGYVMVYRIDVEWKPIADD